MTFGMVSRVGRGMGVLDGVKIVERKGAVLGVNVGVPLKPIGTLLRSCARAATRSSQITLGVIVKDNVAYSAYVAYFENSML